VEASSVQGTIQAERQIREALSQGSDLTDEEAADALLALDALLARLAEAEEAVTQERYFRDEAVEAAEARLAEAEKRLAMYEEPGWINPAQKVVELQAALAEAERFDSEELNQTKEALTELIVRAGKAEKRLAKAKKERDDADRHAGRAIKRAEAAEGRIKELAVMFGVPDGGRYLNDWKTRAAALDPEQQA
jgi:chromosome segregation ATPase